MRWAGASVLVAVIALVVPPQPCRAANSSSWRQDRGRRKEWTQEELALAHAVAGVEYEEEADDAATTPAVPGCSACRLREEMKNFSLESIKEQILSKLGIERPPDTTGRALPKVPAVLLEKYHTGSLAVTGMLGDEPISGADEEDDYHARTEKVIAFAQRSNHSHVKLRHKRRGQDVLNFRFSEKLTRNRVQKALLWVYVRGSEGLGPSPPLTITVLGVLRGSEGVESPLTNIVSTKVSRQNDSEGSWVPLDVRKLLESWFQVPSDNLSLVLQASGPADLLSHDSDGSMVPFLEVYVSDNHKRRSKRNLKHDCDEKSEETRCCRYPLTVDFEAFGWDWIIAPKKYEANYCSGECPYVFLQKYPHTYLTDIARLPGTAGPCCAPRKLSAITMLYFDQQYNIVFGTLPGMVVDRCGCS